MQLKEQLCKSIPLFSQKGILVYLQEKATEYRQYKNFFLEHKHKTHVCYVCFHFRHIFLKVKQNPLKHNSFKTPLLEGLKKQNFSGISMIIFIPKLLGDVWLLGVILFKLENIANLSRTT